MVSFLEATKPRGGGGGYYPRFHGAGGGGGGGGITPDFMWQGLWKDFFGFESFDSSIFLSRENVASTFLGGLI